MWFIEMVNMSKNKMYDGNIDLELLNFIKACIWNYEPAFAKEEIFIEMQKHAIAALAVPQLPNLKLNDITISEWEKYCIRTFRTYHQLLRAQLSLPISVPYVILKGTSAAKYYPHPEYRNMGDIDLITRREDYETACECLIANGYQEIQEGETKRHREFILNHIIVEVHAYFASLNDPRQAEYLDHLIIKNINPSHELPDLVNGLVILEHISQHLEHGLGLRQIIDWMMFVNHFLSDAEWPAFQKMAREIGMERLAVVTTHMCEIYLGLPERKWSANVDERICEDLMAYVLDSGNFGNKWLDTGKSHIKKITYSRTLKGMYHLLQHNGIENWKKVQSFHALRPFAWIYQVSQYITVLKNRPRAVRKVKSDLEEARNRNKLFDALGVKQRSKGLVIYENGKYIKKKDLDF